MLNNSGLQWLSFLLNKCWGFFNITFPGLNVSIGHVLLSFIITSFVIKLIGIAFGLVPNSGDSIRDISKGD